MNAVGCSGVEIVVAIEAAVTVEFWEIHADIWFTGNVKVGIRIVDCGNKTCTL